MATEQPRAIEIRQDEVLTGEAVALDVQPLSFFQRALGCAIDVATQLVLLIVLAIVSAWLVGGAVIDPAASPILGITVAVVVLVAVPTAVETLTGGRSLGRWAVGGRIVRADGGAAGFRHAFIRAFIGVLEIWLTVGAIAAIVGAFSPRTQRLGDLVAGTYCERTRAPRLTTAVVELPAALAGWATVADVARLPDRLARRVGQFVHHADALEPSARARVAAALAAEVAAWVSPVPQVDPELMLRGVAVLRRDRELRALSLQNERLATLTAGDPDTATVRTIPARSPRTRR